MRIAEGDSADLDFVMQCLFTGAISMAELRRWADHAIENLPAPPLWLFDLCEFNEAAFHVYKVIGFTPSGSDANTKAVAGIACLRGRYADPSVNQPSTAVAALARHPETAARFNATFPFLEPVFVPPET